jgi:hypothetical protein
MADAERCDRMKRIDPLTGSHVIPLEEALERALREDADNPVLFRVLWRAQDWAVATTEARPH